MNLSYYFLSQIVNNQFMVTVPVDSVVTLSTIKDGPQHGNPPDKIPDSATFPVPYNDTFDSMSTFRSDT